MKIAKAKGKEYTTSHVKEIIPLLVNKIFEHEIDQEVIDLSLNLDCMITNEAESVQREMENQLVGIVLSHFPDLGSYLPEELFFVTDNLELVIHVPDNYETQRGIFF